MKISKSLYEDLKKLRRAMIDGSGRELHNPIPVAIPIGLNRPPTLQEQIQRVLRQELSRQADAQGHETFDEADDFDVEDDDQINPISQYEIHEMIPEEPIPPNPLPVTSQEKDLDPSPEPDPDPQVTE